ncbi:MAG: class I SAM-dependent methyltransferase [Rhizomicrobium sp.]
MTQNIYDNEQFFAGYSRLPRSERGLDGAPEWASIRAMLPEIAGLRVLDLGCGFGWFCRWALDRCALTVTGIDVSKNMLARAREESDPAIQYIDADLEHLTIARGSADLVYSSLAFHYLKNLDALMAEIAGALAPGGRLVFSVEHPMVTAPLYPGWQKDKDGTRIWPVNHYLEDGTREVDWLGKEVIKQHRSMTTYLNMLVRHGLTLTHIEEWGPTDAQAAAQPSLLDERQRPNFLLVSAVRR